MNESIEHWGITLHKRNDDWIAVYTYVCKKHRHLILIPEDEIYRNKEDRKNKRLIETYTICPRCQEAP